MSDDIGTALVVREFFTDKRVVVHADPLIMVAAELLRPGATDPGAWVPEDDGGVLTLDSDGEYRYRHVRQLPDGCYLFERIR